MEQFNAEGEALLKSYFVGDNGKLVLYRKGMERPHYRGVRPEDIHAWHKAADVSRVGSASESKKKSKGQRKPPKGSSATRRQRKSTTSKR